ncbi:MAG: hypothetical protein JXX28_02415 [Deltaproteobacteria bacterium]|nr:hypothetical protein [Deltaproteobacteria bacterium]
MRPALTLALLIAVRPALAGTPEDVTPSLMGSYQGMRLSGSQQDAWVQLVEELGAAVANKSFAPAETLGALGFDLSAGSSFVFHSLGSEEEPSPWDTSHPSGDPGRVLSVPHLAIRKGLPMSFEVGMDLSWVAMSRQGAFGGYTRLALVEGYKPWPDITLQGGYSGYVGNDELGLGVTDLGLSIGSTYPFGTIPGLRSAQFSPWFNASMLRIRANPTVDADVADALGLVPIGGSADDALKASTLARLGLGFQITNGTLLLRLLGTWVPGTLPTASIAMGFSY